MPHASYSDALKEIYATADNSDVVVNCLELSHTDLAESIFIHDKRSDTLDITLETLVVETFTSAPFRFSLPGSDSDGVEELQLAMDNVNRGVSDFLDQIVSPSPLQVTYRAYLLSDLTTPQFTPPLVLFLTDVKENEFEVTGRATFVDIVNAELFNDYYDRTDFPGLRS